jgi:uncharacterized protein with gpF-like domain
MRFLPHLVEFNEKYRERGLETIMPTDVDSVADLEKFVAEKKLKLGVARVPDVYKLLKAQGYPTAYALDADGVCIWRGHPQQYTAELAESWLKGLRTPKIPRKLSDAVSNAVSSYDGVQYGTAINALEKALKNKDDQVKADAQYIADLLNGRIEMHKAAGKLYRDSGALDQLVPLLEGDAKDFSGIDYAKECASEAKKVKASKAYKDCIEAREKLEKLKPTLKDMKPADAQKALNKLSKEFGETPAGKDAAELAKEYEEKR